MNYEMLTLHKGRSALQLRFFDSIKAIGQKLDAADCSQTQFWKIRL